MVGGWSSEPLKDFEERNVIISLKKISATFLLFLTFVLYSKQIRKMKQHSTFKFFCIPSIHCTGYSHLKFSILLKNSHPLIGSKISPADPFANLFRSRQPIVKSALVHAIHQPTTRIYFPGIMRQIIERNACPCANLSIKRQKEHDSVRGSILCRNNSAQTKKKHMASSLDDFFKNRVLERNSSQI